MAKSKTYKWKCSQKRSITRCMATYFLKQKLPDMGLDGRELIDMI